MKALETQIGGNHYKDMKIQPLEFIMANNLPYCEANIIKYVCRYKSKNGLQDLNKARHYLDILIEHEQRRIESGDSEARERTSGTL
jgi:hypothetical protein